MRRAAASLVLGAVAVAAAAPAAALFDRPAVQVAGTTFTAATLEPPGVPSVVWTCSGVNATGTMSWPASPSTFVQGYRVYSAGALLGSTASTTITVSARRNDRLTLQVEAFAHNWSSGRRTVNTRATC